ncbi:MAG TPA: acyl carrier protein [Ktedonobacterales bacterium]|jgi:acyl carrier protein|nr:acyl carrier protein [Ktedonobacterales bacterium]
MTSTVGAANLERLKDLLVDVLLIDPSEFRLTLKKADVDTWDSLAVVAVAVGIEEVFGYHPTTGEATRLQSVQDIVTLLEEKGIAFDA